MRGYVTWGRALGGTIFLGTALLGWFWVGQLVAVGSGWQPLAEAVGQVAQAVLR